MVDAAGGKSRGAPSAGVGGKPTAIRHDKKAQVRRSDPSITGFPQNLSLNAAPSASPVQPRVEACNTLLRVAGRFNSLLQRLLGETPGICYSRRRNARREDACPSRG